LGITVALQKVVMNTLAGLISDPTIGNEMSDATTDFLAQSGGAGMNNMFNLTIGNYMNSATPLVFLIIVAVYVAEIVVIMLYFTTKVQEDNDLILKISIAKYLPIAVTIFIVTALFSSMMVSSLL